MAGDLQDHNADDVDEADGPFRSLVDYFDGPITAFPSLDYLAILAGLAVMVIGAAAWLYAVFS